MQMLIDSQRSEIKEKTSYCKVLENVVEDKKKIFDDLRSQYDARVNELAKSMDQLNDTKEFLLSTKESLTKIECDKNKQKRLVEKHVETEKLLRGQIETITNVIDEVTRDVQKLHDKIDYKTEVQEKNKKLALQMWSGFTKRCENIEDVFSAYQKEIHTLLQSTKDKIETHIAAQAANIEESIRSTMDHVVHQHFIESKKAKRNVNTLYTNYQKVLSAHMQDTSVVMENENRELADINSKLAPDILNLFGPNYDSFKQDLQLLGRNITEKLESMSAYTKSAVETICSHRLKEYHCMRKDLNEIGEHIYKILQNKKQITEDYKKFRKEMKTVSDNLNILDNCDTIRYSEIAKTSHQIDEVCNNVYDQHVHGYNAEVVKQNDLKGFLHCTASLIKNDIDGVINQVETANKTVTEKGNALVINLQERLSIECDTLKRYNNNITFGGKQLQEKMAKDTDKILSSSADTFTMTENMGLNHIRFMQEQQNKITDGSRMMNDIFTNKRTELSNCNNNIIEKLRASQKQIDKFLTEDYCRDICTGTTPERKIFSYPHEFAKMSPPE